MEATSEEPLEVTRTQPPHLLTATVPRLKRGCFAMQQALQRSGAGAAWRRACRKGTSNDLEASSSVHYHSAQACKGLLCNKASPCGKAALPGQGTGATWRRACHRCTHCNPTVTILMGPLGTPLMASHPGWPLPYPVETPLY